MRRRLLSTALAALSGIAGCVDYSTPDSHREVFKTPEQAAGDRRTQNQTAWLDLAITMLKADRPDVKARKAESSFGLVLSENAVERVADFGPVEEELSHHSEREREIVHNRLTDEVRAFDAMRFRALGFEAAKTQMFPQFVNGKQLAAMQKEFPGSPLHATPVVTDLSWVPVLRRETGDVMLPVADDLIHAWNTSPAAVDSAAVANLRSALKKNTPPVETLSFGALGRSGSLKAGLGAEVILLPEFLDRIRAEWKTPDDLVIFVPSRAGALLAERHNEKLLDKLVPEWKKIGAATDPLCDQLLLRTNEGLSLFGYTPTTRPAAPATKPATTKPEIYIVH